MIQTGPLLPPPPFPLEAPPPQAALVVVIDVGDMYTHRLSVKTVSVNSDGCQFEAKFLSHEGEIVS